LEGKGHLRLRLHGPSRTGLLAGASRAPGNRSSPGAVRSEHRGPKSERATGTFLPASDGGRKLSGFKHHFL